MSQMIIESRSVPTGRVVQRSAELWLQGRRVGTVMVSGHDGPWRFGRFAQGPGFAPFAALFAQWARLMHASHDSSLSDQQRAELAVTERLIDRLHASLTRPDGIPRPIAQLAIDGELIEWKERYPRQEAADH